MMLWRVHIIIMSDAVALRNTLLGVRRGKDYSKSNENRTLGNVFLLTPSGVSPQLLCLSVCLGAIRGDFIDFL